MQGETEAQTQAAQEVTVPFGRPLEYRPEFCQKVIEYGKEGKSVTQIACLLGFHKDTLYDWSSKFKDFSDALSLSRQYAQAWFEDVGQNGLFADKFQATLWAKQVSCRFPEDYRDNSKLDATLSGPNGGPVQTEVVVRFAEETNRDSDTASV